MNAITFAKALIAGLIILSCGRPLHSARACRPFETHFSHQECMLIDILQWFRPLFALTRSIGGRVAPTPPLDNTWSLSDSITALGLSDARAFISDWWCSGSVRRAHPTSDVPSGPIFICWISYLGRRIRLLRVPPTHADLPRNPIQSRVTWKRPDK